MSADKQRSPFAKLALSYKDMGERQDQFAARLGVKRTTITNLNTGHAATSDPVLDALLELDPDRAKEIEAAYEESKTPRTQRDSSGVYREIRRLIDAGRPFEAITNLTAQLQGAPTDHERSSLLRLLARARFAADDENGGIEAQGQAIEAGEHADPGDKTLNELRDDLAERHQRRDEFAQAHAVLDAGLRHDYEAGVLWRRKAIVHCYEHAYGSALAALELAKKYKEPARRLVHVRATILTEWGRYDDALKEFEQIFVTGNPHKLSQTTLARARAERAYVLVRADGVRDGMKEFARAEKEAPDNGWLHYWRAQWYLDNGQTDRAMQGFTTALEAQGRPLNLPKRQEAERILREHNLRLPSSSKR